jgi:hypothetical protein
MLFQRSASKIIAQSFAIILSAALTGCNDDVAPGVSRAAATRIENLIKAQLRDPQSLQVDWVPYDKSLTYCSTYNAKNSFGGYAGRHRFLAFVLFEDGNIKTVNSVSLETDLTAGNVAIDTFCKSYMQSGSLPAR